jgi:hypothetical protein
MIGTSNGFVRFVRALTTAKRPMKGELPSIRCYKTVSAMIAGLKGGEIRAAAELSEVVHEAVKSEKLAEDFVTIVLGLLPAKTRRKMLQDPSVPSAKIIHLFPEKN